MDTARIKIIVRNKIGRLFSKNESVIKEHIDKSDVVSFDIFDTLVKRKVPFPQDVFKMVEQKYKEETGKEIIGYTKQRILAEKNARRNCTEEEVTLDEIYTSLSLKKNKDEIKQLEQRMEEEVCYSNIRMFNIYEYARKKGKCIIITSDMYLPEKTIENILNKCKYTGYSKIYLSSLYRKTKHIGSIFDIIAKEYTGNTILHIGDNVRSDYLIPKIKGLNAVLINRCGN